MNSGFYIKLKCQTRNVTNQNSESNTATNARRAKFKYIPSGAAIILQTESSVLLFNVLNCLVSYYKTKFSFKGREARPRPTHVQTANGCGSLGTKKYF